MDPVTHQARMLIRLLAEDPADPANVREALSLKALHTVCVADNALRLAQAAGGTPRDIELAVRIGWCHDLGRFLQFRRYHTFDDAKSVDHGRLSLKLIRALHLDRDLAPEEKGLLWAAVLLHNRRELPLGLPGRTRFFAALLRDADRLDIFRIFRAYYEAGPVPGSPLELYYPDTGRVTPAVLQAILAGTSPPYELGSSVQDMRLIKLSWVYTLETPGAAELFRTSGILNATRAVLPDTAEIREVLTALEAWTPAPKNQK